MAADLPESAVGQHPGGLPRGRTWGGGVVLRSLADRNEPTGEDCGRLLGKVSPTADSAGPLFNRKGHLRQTGGVESEPNRRPLLGVWRRNALLTIGQKLGPGAPVVTTAAPNGGQGCDSAFFVAWN